MKRAGKLIAPAIAVVAIVTVAVMLVASHIGSKATLTVPSSDGTSTRSQTPAPAGGKGVTSPSVVDPTPAAVVKAFAASYARYLDGGRTNVVDASITATDEVEQAGRIPATFRDGDLRINGATPMVSTCCSAEQTVTIANRQESYPFTVQLLDDGPHGWQIASLTAPDLSMDDHLQSVKRAAAPPAGGEQAARRFAVAYTAFKAGTGPRPAMSSTALKELTNGQDSLAGAKREEGAVRLAAIAFGPPSGNEFAATATVKIAGVKETLTFLMVHQDGSWIAGAFL